jgi:hypothetical protein
MKMHRVRPIFASSGIGRARMELEFATEQPREQLP